MLLVFITDYSSESRSKEIGFGRTGRFSVGGDNRHLRPIKIYGEYKLICNNSKFLGIIDI